MGSERSRELPEAEAELQLRVDQLVRACDELERSRDYYKALFDDQPVGQIVFDGAGLIGAVNTGAAALLGQDPSSMVGKPFIVYVAEGYRRVFLDHLRRAKADLSQPVRDSLDLHAAEKWISVELLTRAFQLAEGIECNTAVVALQPDRFAHAGIAKLAPLLGQANDAVIVRTIDGRILAWNPAAEDLYGFTEREVLGANILPLLCPHPISSFRESEADLVKTGKWSGSLACRRRDGTRVHVETRWGLVRASEGTPQTVVQIDRDASGRHAMDIAVRNRMRRQAGRSQPALGDLASALAYDVQEPLRALVGYLELLKKRYRGQAGREAEEFTELALAESSRLRAMLDDLRIYCNAALVQGEAQPASVARALEEAMTKLGPAISATGAKIHQEGLPAVRVAPNHLRELMTRLLSNALKFRSGRPVEVTVRGRELGAMVEIAFADNGIGIPLAERDRLFHPFGRLHTEAEYPGHGMGLAISRRIVEHWGGHIWFESKPGEGSTFFFTLPSGSAPREEEQGRSSSA